MFEIGQRVVCITKGPWHCLITGRLTPEPVPKYNRTYVVTWEGFVPVGGYIWPAIGLAGIADQNFHPRNFRPVEIKKTSIEVFKQILVKPPKVPVNV